MRILPVIDVMGGQVVRAVGGRRAEYRPLVSRLTDSTEPLAVTTAIRARFGWSEIYLADLDAIERRRPPAFDLYRRLDAAGLMCWVDAGVRRAADTADNRWANVAQVVIGSETLTALSEWSAIAATVGTHRTVFSLDLSEGRLLRPAAWLIDDPMIVAECVIAAGARRMFVLDLARVGRSAGTGTDDLIRQLVRHAPQVEVFVGGGIRDAADIRRLRDLGAAGALVASALHDGRIAADDLASA